MLPTRFWIRVTKTTDCWLWSAATTGAGYGAVWMDGRLRLAHKVAWEDENGPVPDGMELDHECRNTRCVRPSHLEPVTHQVNVQRGRAGERQSSKTRCSKGHELTPANTYVYPATAKRAARRECRACRKAYMADHHSRKVVR
jgi:hypothetical protein